MNNGSSIAFGAVGTVAGIASMLTVDPASVQAIATMVATIICAMVSVIQTGKNLVKKIMQILEDKKHDI